MTSNQTAGIYVHIPFCERKCTYCNFNTTDFAAEVVSPYVQAVVREIGYWGEQVRRAADSSRESAAPGAGEPLNVDTIYFGGGTPSLVEAEHLGTILNACRRSFEVSEETEVTIEINPATLTRDKMSGWLQAGINRASVGVQSFLDTELISLSRTHTSDRARHTVDALREAGFQNLSLDLIAGLPEQTRADWEYNLQQALRIGPEHLSLYLLEVKEGTQLFSQIKRGLRPAPDDDLAAEMYEMICRATAAAGYEQYEISNFALVAGAKKKSLRSKHNMKYWTGAPFYGIGCGAHSYDGRARRVNTLQTETYIEQVASTGHATKERRELDDKERAEEAIFMGLRLTEGIALEEFQGRYGVDILGQYGRELEHLTEAGLIEVEEQRLRLTARGRLLSNEVFLTFV